MAEPGNALMGRRGPAPTDDTPEMEMERLMRETGYTGKDPAEGMAHVWKAMPTDSVAELIDMLSGKHGIPPPWDPNAAPVLPQESTPQAAVRADIPSDLPGPPQRGGRPIGNSLMRRR
jgi:hypothetical protein